MRGGPFEDGDGIVCRVGDTDVVGNLVDDETAMCTLPGAVEQREVQRVTFRAVLQSPLGVLQRMLSDSDSIPSNGWDVANALVDTAFNSSQLDSASALLVAVDWPASIRCRVQDSDVVQAFAALGVDEVYDSIGFRLPGWLASAIMSSPFDEKLGLHRQAVLSDAGYTVATAVLQRVYNGSAFHASAEAPLYDHVTIGAAFWLQWEL